MWQVTCALETAKAMLPFQRQLRLAKDRAIGYQRDPRKDANTIRDGLEMIEWLGDIQHRRILEVGTGWQPMIPILFSLAGATVYMADMHQLIREDTFSAALDAIREHQELIAARMRISREVVAHATRDCRDLLGRLAELRLTYMAPCDCRRLRVEPGGIDIVTSRAVLEHIPPTIVTDIFREANRILPAGGLMLHLVDHSDHWSHRDGSITAVNFLKYPDMLFRATCIHPQNYQNRLRHTDYVAMLAASGFIVKREHGDVDHTCVAAVGRMRVAKRFHRYSTEDLATTRSILLAERRMQ